LSNLSSGRDETILRTIRLPKVLDNLLEEESKRRRMSVNSLVVTILEKFDKWDKTADKFGFVAIPREGLRDVITLVDIPTIRMVGKAGGSRFPREMMLFWFKEVNLEIFLRYIQLQSDYLCYAKYEVVRRPSTIELIAKHDLGENWSIWLEAYVSEAIRTNLRVTPLSEANKDTVKFAFPTSV
jgi:hypothetical protein